MEPKPLIGRLKEQSCPWCENGPGAIEPGGVSLIALCRGHSCFFLFCLGFGCQASALGAWAGFGAGFVGHTVGCRAVGLIKIIRCRNRRYYYNDRINNKHDVAGMMWPGFLGLLSIPSILSGFSGSGLVRLSDFPSLAGQSDIAALSDLSGVAERGRCCRAILVHVHGLSSRVLINGVRPILFALLELLPVVQLGLSSSQHVQSR